MSQLDPMFHARARVALPQFVQDRVDSFYRDRLQNDWSGRHILQGRRPPADALLLQSNDYLAISSHPRIVDAEIGALQRHGNGAMMSAIFLRDEVDPQHALEARFAQHLGAPAALLCQSGYAANVGLIQAIAGSSGRTPVYVDMLAHASLWEGVNSAGARPIRVFHNDAEHLARQVLRYGPGVIAVDAVYSTTGARCPLAEYVAIANQHGCALIVDESHSLGTHGEFGEGLVHSAGLADQVHFVTASLAKSFCGRAGVISCSQAFKDYFGFTALPAIFSSTLLPHDRAGLDAALDVVREEPWRRARLQAITHWVRRRLSELGYPVANGTEQIIGLEVGSEAATMRVRDVLEEQGIFGSIFCAPATATNRALVRISLNAGLSDAEVERLVGIFARQRRALAPRTWSSYLRAARQDERRLQAA